ncbi:M48 family metallopeptidase [Patescibacteria group bacterium]|nr:M48 family metallopeptidase [Patescibacteria group bacterium]MBU1123549.1 M48 family metallopeptidase [Patescibacteria group bacterium]MBU1911600.1 M48 family metallopeptidase [Patescibacteria group bacterium]
MTPKKRIRHRVERTGNKHSRAVFTDGTIVIRLARNLSRTEAEEHVRDLLRRMTQQLLEEEQKTVIDPFRPLLDGNQSLTITLATGKQYHFTLKSGSRTSARRTSRGWSVTVGPHIRRKGLHSFLWKLLSKSEEKRVRILVHMINDETFSYPLRKITLKFATSQWGSCSTRKVIMLNSALLFTPPSVLKYLIVHELSHLRFGNHSPTYWRNVGSAMPTFKRAREILKDYRLPTL